MKHFETNNFKRVMDTINDRFHNNPIKKLDLPIRTVS